ncbi:MAG: hypothetical protein RL322_1442 [Pseudomonadota bacterium]|jgi:lactate dehydrogenase-like 2-hydroxyacid dehydrogenase
MSRPRLLITRQIFPEVNERLRQSFDVMDNQSDQLWARAELLERAADRDALFVVNSDVVNVELLDAAPRVRIVATGSVGVNHIDRAACAARGIAVTNTPDVLNEATADMAWALLMAAARRVSESERWLRAGQWDRWAFDQFLGADVWQSTLGIVGMGRIGSAIARRARGFDMKILYCNRSPAANADALGAERVELGELLARADHVVLVVPYSAQTHHLIGAAQLAQMKPSATLINIARGGVVDDRALAAALSAGRIAAAGLDVFENEPALHPALLDCRNVVLTPHLGSATRSARVAMAALAADNLIAWSENRALPTPVL